MDAGLFWTAVGSAAGVLGTGLVAWQVRFQLRERHDQTHLSGSGPALSGGDGEVLPVVVPFGRLPAEVRGRDALLAELRGSFPRAGWTSRLLLRGRVSGHTWVLAGMGGLGKSTMALAAAQIAQARGWRVWWVPATDTAAFTGGMLEVLRQLGAPETVVRPVREGSPAAAGRAWDFLNGTHQAGRRWLLVFDNADNPEVLAAPGTADPADHAGWLRSQPLGTLIITSRNQDSRTWGPGIMLRQLAPVDEAAGAKVLADLAPDIPDPGGQQARDLARRLGGLPLALHLAGSYLDSPFARWRTFADYHRALDGAELSVALGDLDHDSDDSRGTIQRTWDLSLKTLDANGQLDARAVLLLLSCYAPATPIPAGLLQPQALSGLLPAARERRGSAGPDVNSVRARRLRASLEALAAVGLINAAKSDDPASPLFITVHPVITDVNRVRLQAAGQSACRRTGQSAVRELCAATTRLDHEQPADWPTWRRLVPHILAMLGWLPAHLSSSTLGELSAIASNAALAQTRSGNTAAAEPLARSAVAASKPLGDDSPVNLFCRYALAEAAEAAGRNGEAEKILDEVLAGQQRVLGADHPDTLATRHQRARVIGHTRYPEAEHLLREILADRQRVLGEDHPCTLATQHALARTVGRHGAQDESAELFRQVLARQRRVMGENHPDTLAARHGLAWATSGQDRDAEAEIQFRDLLADRQAVLGQDHFDVLSTRHSLAMSIARQGRHAEAEPQYRQVLADQQRILGADHPSTLFTRLNLAAAIAGQGRTEEAETLLRQLISDQHQAIGGDHPITLIAVHALADALSARGQHEEARQLYQQALDGRRRVLGDTHPRTQATRDALDQVTKAPLPDHHTSKRTHPQKRENLNYPS